MVGFVEWIKDTQVEEGLQMNPDFQRGHVWTEEQQTAYIEYILRGGESGKAFYFNYPSRKISVNNGYNEFVCVDGLQRSTAIQRFINNEIKVFGQYYKDFGSKLIRMEYSMSVYINDLQSEKEVLEWYVQMNAGGTPHTKEEIERVKKMMEQL